MAVYLGAPRSDAEPDLVLAVAREDTAHLARAGSAEHFGDPKPLGALGVRIGGDVVWPTYLPRQPRRSDPSWSQPETPGAGEREPMGEPDPLR